MLGPGKRLERPTLTSSQFRRCGPQIVPSHRKIAWKGGGPKVRKGHHFQIVLVNNTSRRPFARILKDTLLGGRLPSEETRKYETKLIGR